MDADNGSHSGWNTSFWRNGGGKNYDAIQSLLSEKKAEEQENIFRIIKYFCDSQQIANATILDIGCGSGTPITLTRYVLAWFGRLAINHQGSMV